MNITFGNKTNRDYYRIEYLLEEKGNFGFCYPQNKLQVEKLYKQLQMKGAIYFQITLSPPKSVYLHEIAYYCKKEFVDKNRILRKQGLKELNFKEINNA